MRHPLRPHRRSRQPRVRSAKNRVTCRRSANGWRDQRSGNRPPGRPDGDRYHVRMPVPSISPPMIPAAGAAEQRRSSEREDEKAATGANSGGMGADPAWLLPDHEALSHVIVDSSVAGLRATVRRRVWVEQHHAWLRSSAPTRMRCSPGTSSGSAGQDRCYSTKAGVLAPWSRPVARCRVGRLRAVVQREMRWDAGSALANRNPHARTRTNTHTHHCTSWCTVYTYTIRQWRDAVARNAVRVHRLLRRSGLNVGITWRAST
jgi:hypothetical protein